jgi:hypothetical protein
VPALVWVLDGELLEAPGPNATAAALLVADLEARGLVRPLDVASVGALVALASAIDGHPGDARLWAEYRAAVAAVSGLDGGPR